jgi:hypothetical protein
MHKKCFQKDQNKMSLIRSKLILFEISLETKNPTWSLTESSIMNF